jgi:mycothiol synthase
LLDAYESWLCGEPRTSEDDAVAEANDPESDIAHNWWVVEMAGDAASAADGVGRSRTPAALACIYWPSTCEGRGLAVVHPDHRDDDKALTPCLLELIEGRARELARCAPPDRAPALFVYCDDADPGLAGALSSRGYRRVREGFAMRIDLRAGHARPIWPAGITVREARPGVDDRALWRADDEAFSEHFLYHPQSFEVWHGWLFGHAGLDPYLWVVAWDGDEVAGQCIAYPRGSAGLVDDLMVRRPWRRQGLGLALLLEVFGRLHERGYDDVFLGVDAENATGAVRVYEKAGMRVWRRGGSFRLDLM